MSANILDKVVTAKEFVELVSADVASNEAGNLPVVLRVNGNEYGVSRESISKQEKNDKFYVIDLQTQNS